MSEKGLGPRPARRAWLFLLPGACSLGYLALCNKITSKLSDLLSFPWNSGVRQGTILAWSPSRGSAGCCPGPQSSQGVAGAGALDPRLAFSQQVGAGRWWEDSAPPNTAPPQACLGCPSVASVFPQNKGPRSKGPGRRCSLLVTYPWKRHSIVFAAFYS